MSKKLDKNTARQVMDTKTMIYVYAKRVGIIALVSLPIILFINYFLSNEVSGYTTVAQVLCTILMFGTALFVGFIIFSKRDKKRREIETKESARDPFAD